MWKTDYLGIHERAYQRLKELGKSGWSTPRETINRFQGLTERIAKTFGHQSPRSVLVLGCGDGGIALELSRNGFDVTGIDISPTAVAWAREKAISNHILADFQVTNVLALSHADESFDLVVDDHCFHCIIGGDRGLFLANSRRVLKSGGMLFIRSVCGDLPKNAPQQLKDAFDSETRIQYSGLVAGRYFGMPDVLIAEVERAQFKIVNCRLLNDPDGSNILEIEAAR